MNKLTIIARSFVAATLVVSLTACGANQAEQTKNAAPSPQAQTSQQPNQAERVNVVELAATVTSQREQLLNHEAGFGQTVRDLVCPNGLWTSARLERADQNLDDQIKQATADTTTSKQQQHYAQSLNEAWQTWQSLLSDELISQASSRFTTTLKGLQPYLATLHARGENVAPECRIAGDWSTKTLPPVAQSDDPLASWKAISTLTQQLQDDWSACTKALGSDASHVLGAATQ